MRQIIIIYRGIRRLGKAGQLFTRDWGGTEQRWQGGYPDA